MWAQIFQDSVRRALAGFEEVGDVRGRGFFIGIELVRDRNLARALSRRTRIELRHRTAGLRATVSSAIRAPATSTASSGDTIILAPPYNASDAELEEIIVKLTRAVEGALAAG